MREVPVTDSVHRPSIAEIFWVFCRIGLMSFGGGVSGWIYREVVVKRGWLNENEFMSNLATSQILPGSNIANLAVTLAYKLRGTWGSCVALFALMSGPFFGVLALAAVYDQLKTLTFSEAVLDGVAAAAIGLVAGDCRVPRRTPRRCPAGSPDRVVCNVYRRSACCIGRCCWSCRSSGLISVAIAWRKAGHEG